VGGAALDLMDEPDAVARVLDVIVEAALEFITFQVKAGAHAVGIDSFLGDDAALRAAGAAETAPSVAAWVDRFLSARV